MSGAFVGALFLVMSVAYVFLRSSPSDYPRYKQQVLRRRIWFRKEKARNAESEAFADILDLGTWHNPTLIIARTEEFPVGISFEFESDPPLLQRDYKGEALLRIDKPDEARVVAEIMDPKTPKDHPVLRVLVRGEKSDLANPGDSFRFLANPNLR